MNVIRIAVCDDEERVLHSTLNMLKQYNKEKLAIDCYGSGEELLQSSLQYDIILLDIDMKELNGIETAKRIREKDREVKLIYITNYSDYSMFAFAVHAFAYLLKPLKKEDLFAQLDEALIYGLPKDDKELEFSAIEGIVRIKTSQILYFEYMERQVLIHTEKRVWHLRQRIADIDSMMREYGFVMPHKSFVVNLYAVRSISGYDIILTDGNSIPLSQKKSTEFRRALNNYLAKERG